MLYILLQHMLMLLSCYRMFPSRSTSIMSYIRFSSFNFTYIQKTSTVILWWMQSKKLEHITKIFETSISNWICSLRCMVKALQREAPITNLDIFCPDYLLSKEKYSINCSLCIDWSTTNIVLKFKRNPEKGDTKLNLIKKEKGRYQVKVVQFINIGNKK